MYVGGGGSSKNIFSGLNLRFLLLQWLKRYRGYKKLSSESSSDLENEIEVTKHNQQ